jgi:hypothetical protein
MHFFSHLELACEAMPYWENWMNADTPSEKPTEGEPDTETEQRIRRRAHLLWEAEGRQEGGVKTYWHRARELIEDEAKSAYPPTQSRGNRT